VETIESQVQSQMDNAWAETKAAASATGRREQGFVVYLNSYSSVYQCEPAFYGQVVQCGTTAGVDLIANYDVSDDDPTYGGKYAVALFHTHTPLTYCTNPPALRLVGPSSTDISSSYLIYSGVPGMVYDYVGAYIERPEYSNFKGIGIEGGHNINDAAQITTYGVARRTTSTCYVSPVRLQKWHH
jgi:hypothetical protein